MAKGQFGSGTGFLRFTFESGLVQGQFIGPGSDLVRVRSFLSMPNPNGIILG